MSSMKKHLFNLKFGVKKLNIMSKQYDIKNRNEKVRYRKALQEGIKIAQIHAEDASRQKNQSLNCLEIIACVDASNAESALTTTEVAVKDLDRISLEFRKEAENEIRKFDDAIQKCIEVSRIHGKNATQLKKKSLIYLRSIAHASYILSPLATQRCVVKELEKVHKRYTTEVKKYKKAIQKGLKIGSIHAKNATEQKKRALNYAKMSACVQSDVQSALTTRKFVVKKLKRTSEVCELAGETDMLKCKKAIKKGIRVGLIHAKNAIQQKKQSLKYLEMSARVNTIASRVQSALTTRRVSQSMADIVKAMDAAMKSMKLKKMSNLMDKFETQFENLDVKSSCMENAMSQTTTTTVLQQDVENFMLQAADEVLHELSTKLSSGRLGSVGTSTQVSQEQEKLTQQLARFRE